MRACECQQLTKPQGNRSEDSHRALGGGGEGGGGGGTVCTLHYGGAYFVSNKIGAIFHLTTLNLSRQTSLSIAFGIKISEVDQSAGDQKHSSCSAVDTAIFIMTL